MTTTRQADLEIEVVNEAVSEREIIGSRGPFAIRDQQAWARWPGDAYPTKCTLQLASGKPAHRPGRYRLAPSSLTVDRFGRLEVKRYLDLIPILG